jgi:2-polyprenyl-3-methyl-5-hydroxy-6-metoxy-1,4-benzoquinol methylase
MANTDQVEYDPQYVQQAYAESYASFKALPGFEQERKSLSHRFKFVLHCAQIQISSSGTYMDLGSGLGIKTRIIAENFGQSLGLDFVERCVAIANLLNDWPTLRFVQADATKPSGHRYDFVTAFGLSVFNVHDVQACATAIAAAARDHCKPGGTFLLYSFTDFSGQAPSGWVNHRKQDLETLVKALQSAGLQAQIVFPQRRLGNYFGNGLRHLAAEWMKLLSRKRRDYYIVIRTPQD